MPSSARTPDDDLELLRAHEPVLRYTRGELFHPADVERYVASCSLWAGGPGERSRRLAGPGELSLSGLAEHGRTQRGRPTYLRYVERGLTRAELRRWRALDRPRLQGAQRFLSVGLAARAVDTAVRISLLLRGRVPGGVVAAAEQQSTAADDPSSAAYYGRVVREAGYTVLQYWYFYACNDWRSTFYGVNDHEADWETISVFLAADDEDGPAVWVAASSHDHAGPDLRRRRDDPDATWQAGHPVVFAGAGSHSGAFLPGDYVVAVQAPAVRRLAQRWQRLRRRLIPWSEEPTSGGIALPYVDYARGDGLVIGPGGDRAWRPVLIADDTPWVRDFRGLWGLDTRDRLGGERAPAGPRYERGGTVRLSWASPVAWAGLTAEAPTAHQRRADLRLAASALTEQVVQLDTEVDARTGTARQARARALALGPGPAARSLLAAADGEQAAVAGLVVRRDTLLDERARHAAVLSGSSSAVPDVAPQAHLVHPAVPHDREQRRAGFARVWAAISIPVLLLAVAVLIAVPSTATVTVVGVGVLAFALVEAVIRRRTVAFVAGLVTVLAVGALGWLLVSALLSGWQTTLAVVLGAVAAVLLVVNLRELLRLR